MRPQYLILALVVSSVATAKPWNGVEPGITRRDDIIKKFGEPSRAVVTEGKEVLAYYNKDAIKGTTQAQFKVDPDSKLLERIDVFPLPTIDRETIEQTYGPACPASGQSKEVCYIKKLTDDFRTYFLYPKLGLAIFFNEDGKTVHSFIFQTLKASK